MTEVLFYHLERQPLERVLPMLLEKTLQRDWRAVVQTGSEERSEALSQVLWTWREESFLPHGTRRDGRAEHQPIWLTEDDDNPNGARVRFLVDGAQASSLEDLDRVVYLFDGNDSEAVEAARRQWKTLAGRGHATTYWRQDPDGRWQNKT